MNDIVTLPEKNLPARRKTTRQLSLNLSSPNLVYLTPHSGPTAIEEDDFPFEVLSEIAEKESWRKEIYRPTTHIHKWWAQRLGTVFRAMTIGAFAPSGTNLMDIFYKPVRIKDPVVFDPFMGSGTTINEVIKLGARGIGRDINPVSYFLVKCALSVYDRSAVLQTYRAIEADIADTIRRFYRTTVEDDQIADVLYYFWVKIVICPSCHASVDLFSSMIFARHAYPKKFPKAQAVCPSCGAINQIHFQDKETLCTSCHLKFNPTSGNANGKTATCPSCSHSFPIAKTVRAGNTPPDHRLYAKLVLLANGTKAYLPITEEDRALYLKAQRALSTRKNPYPVVAINPGYNTNQALGYNYRQWHEMFNARQLLCLSILADRIRDIRDPKLRALFTCLFSGTLEFNNMFASYKGEGTGAVRHMFAHHILKPERTPLEANLWGTPKSSGSFSTMFESRILRALNYADNPFELRLGNRGRRKTSEKIFSISEKIGIPHAQNYLDFTGPRRVYLSCGDSGSTDLPNSSVDVVLTDPPFFDNVHYSELADFFHVWQRHILGEDGFRKNNSTRSKLEVQSANADEFTDRLSGVWKEAYRVLKDDGLLAFTYHHSRSEGWRSILRALMHAGFQITAAHPIKAEMSVAMPKHQAKEPIDLDIIIVCRKRSYFNVNGKEDNLWNAVHVVVMKQTGRLIDAGRYLSRNDIRVIIMAQLVRHLSNNPSLQHALRILDEACDESRALIAEVQSVQELAHERNRKD